MTRQLSRGQATSLGAVLLLGLALAGWALWGLEERRGLGRDSIVVEAGFADIAGVHVGTRVRIQGIDAGEVEAIDVPAAPGDEVKLRLRLAGKLRHLLTADSRVQIAGENLLAGKVVRILPGSSQAGLIEHGGRLASAPTSDLADVAAQATTRLTSVLGEVDAVLQDFRKGQGSLGTIAQDLGQSSARLNTILARVDTMLTDVEKGKGSLGLLLKDDSLHKELTGALMDARAALSEIRGSQGTIAKLVKSDEVYAETLQSLQDVRRMVTSVKQNSDAVKSLPVVRSYVVDAHKILVRPECERRSKWYPATDLFEPGRAVLTAEGRQRLDEGAAWLDENKERGSEVVIAAYAAPSIDDDVARTLTQKQSEAVYDYLRSTHRVHRTGWWWWSTRPVRPLGVGNHPPALAGTEKLPPSRIELLVFVPGS